MNAFAQAQSAYASISPIRSNRANELEALVRTTNLLRRADSHSKLVTALFKNRELWAILASDVAGEGNALPRQLRAQIFYLAEFTVQQSRKILAGQATPEALIDINNAVIAGLSGTEAA